MPRDGLLRGAYHRARIRATRWLAMTTPAWGDETRDKSLLSSRLFAREPRPRSGVILSRPARSVALENPGAPFPGSFALVVPMSLQHNPAFNESAAVPTAAAHAGDRVIETSIPARLDALTWSSFHTRVVLALGITWIL